MAVFAMTNVGLFIDSLAVHGFARELDLSAMGDEIDVTPVSSGGWERKIPGNASYTATVTGFQDYALTGIDPTFPITGLGGYDVITLAPTGGTAVGDVAYMTQGLLTSYQPLTGASGEAGVFSFGWAGHNQLVKGQMLHPSAARTATGNGTTTTFTAPTATQALYASFHVLSVSGAGTITFTIQTDDNSGMTTPTTRITSNAFTGVGTQLSSLSGALTGETHIRVVYTISGFTSVTFAVAAGVL